MQVFKLGFSALMGSTAMSVFSLGGSSLLQVYAVAGFTPELVLDFREEKYFLSSTSTTLDAATTYAGASASTYTDSSGALQTALAGVPRVGNHVYNGTTWVNAGLLLESEARTNLLLNSATLSTQSTIVTAAPHTLHFTGTGTITLTGASTAGPLVGTGAGENNRVSLTFTPSAATLTVTVSGTVTNGQLEIGSTPSSYIPTSGSAVTRAAQTLEIAGADMPIYQTITYAGADAVTNGEFATDTGWDKGAGWTISGGTANVVGAGGRLVQTDIIASGPTKLLEVSWDQVITTGTRFRFFPRNAGNTGNTTIISGAATGGATYSSGNCTGSGTFTVYVYTTTGLATSFLAEVGNSGTIDNVSVREINPLAVSISIDGKVTGGTSQFVKWSANASNEILIDAASSTYTFSQEAATVVDTVVGGSFTSGINVPFLLSSRHGSTFLNGAADGTALTANTTPTTIADLSAAAFQIGSTFNGNIGTVRVWPEDITDAGIEEAST